MQVKGEMCKNPRERLQTRHGPRCSCNSPRPAVADLIPMKTARIRKTARCNTTANTKLKHSPQSLEMGMATEAVADRSGSNLTNATIFQAVA